MSGHALNILADSKNRAAQGAHAKALYEILNISPNNLVDTLGTTANEQLKNGIYLSAPQLLLESLLEHIQALVKKPDFPLLYTHVFYPDERGKWYARLAKCYVVAADFYKVEGTKFDNSIPVDAVKEMKNEEKNIWYYRVNGHLIGGSACKLYQWRRAYEFCCQAVKQVCDAAWNDIEATAMLEQKHQLAQAFYCAVPELFYDNVLRAPEDIRKLICQRPNRGSIAFGHIVPTSGSVIKF
jgi:hypothetical protein